MVAKVSVAIATIAEFLEPSLWVLLIMSRKEEEILG